MAGRPKAVYGQPPPDNWWCAYDAHGDFVTWVQGDTENEALAAAKRRGASRVEKASQESPK